jgi:hypothetical protein
MAEPVENIDISNNSNCYLCYSNISEKVEFECKVKNEHPMCKSCSEKVSNKCVICFSKDVPETTDYEPIETNINDYVNPEEYNYNVNYFNLTEVNENRILVYDEELIEFILSIGLTTDEINHNIDFFNN